jgi:hypothetical protein
VSVFNWRGGEAGSSMTPRTEILPSSNPAAAEMIESESNKRVDDFIVVVL